MNADDLLSRVDEILKGIDSDRVDPWGEDGGWWEHSGQVEFGKAKLAELKEAIRAYLNDKNPSTSISSEEVDKSIKKRLAIQKAKPPLNGDQILEGFKKLELAAHYLRLHCFTEGVRFAERMRNDDV